MKAARLFAMLTFIFLVLLGLSKLVLLPGLDVTLHSTYLVFGPELVLLFSVVASANFAVLYYAGERIFRADWNRRLTILHFCLFLCFAIALSLAFTVSGLVTNGSMPSGSLRWEAVPMLLGILSLVASLLVFGLNLTLMVAQILRTRFARR